MKTNDSAVWNMGIEMTAKLFHTAMTRTSHHAVRSSQPMPPGLSTGFDNRVCFGTGLTSAPGTKHASRFRQSASALPLTPDEICLSRAFQDLSSGRQEFAHVARQREGTDMHVGPIAAGLDLHENKEDRETPAIKLLSSEDWCPPLQ